MAANLLEHFLLPKDLKKIHNWFSHLEHFCRIIFGLPYNILGIEYLHIMIPFTKIFVYLKIAFSTVLIPHCLFFIFYFNEHYLFSLLPWNFLKTITPKKLVWFSVLFNCLLSMSPCICSSFWRSNTTIVNMAFFFPTSYKALNQNVYDCFICF